MPDKLVDDLKLALGDAYTIERELTGGGMSRVFVAKEHALGREVVIKVLPPDLAAGVNRERFRREVQLAARLSHPYIVPLLHAGEHDELLWFTMPYIAGESLRTRLERNGALKSADVIKLLHDVVEALAYAHSRGVIHRDIKPANILSDGRHALVTDFGVAKALNAALPMGGPGHTTSGMAIGTPAYMAPEQLAADPDADQRVDIYAVGLLAYELLSGASPFAAPSPTATMTAQLTRIPEPLHQLRADVPEAFSDLVQHCLAKSPDERPKDAQTVLAELDRIAGALAADVHRGGSGETARRAHAPLLPLVVATVGVLAMVAGGFWRTQRSSAKAVVPDSTAPAHVGTDTGDQGVALPVKPMTHQDSLKLLSDLRQQLGQADPKYSRKAVAAPVVTDQVSLEQQVQRTDSLIRARMRDFYQPRTVVIGTTPGRGTTVMISPQAPGTPGSPAVPSAAVVPASHRLAIVAQSNSRGDSALRMLERSAARELAETSIRSTGAGHWDTVVVDTVGASRGSGRSRAPFNVPDSINVLVFINLLRDSTDSVKMSVIVRSTDPATNFGYRVFTSDAAYRPANTAPFRTALNDAARFVRQLRQIPSGQIWAQDFGRGAGTGGPRYQTFVPIPSFRKDSMKQLLDSIRIRFPKRHDSLPE